MSDTKKANPGRPEGQDGIAMLRRMNDSHKPLRDWALPFISWRPGMRILDVGCGGGAAIWDMLSLSENSVIDGVDYSADSVALSSETNKAFLGSRVFIKEGDVGSLPFPNDSYDLVTAIETVYFWPDLTAGLSQIYRVLKSGGQFAVLCEADGPDRVDWSNIEFDLTIYTPTELEAAFEKAGFRGVHHYVDGKGYLTVIGKK